MKHAFLFAFLVISVAHAGQGQMVTTPAASGREPAHVYLPAQYSSEKSWPVVLLLHGYLGSSSSINAYFGYGDEASRRGFILVVPNGLKNQKGDRYWNASEACCDFDHLGNDDEHFLLDLIALVKARWKVDDKRVTVAGHSNGGFMGLRLACASQSPFSAVVSFAGAASLDPTRCRSQASVRVLQIHARDDETIFYEGDTNGYPGLKGYPSANQTVNGWVRRNGCEAQGEAGRPLRLTVLGRDADTSVLSWRNCKSGNRVELWTIAAFSHLLHSPHTPFLRESFTDRTLDFLLGE